MKTEERKITAPGMSKEDEIEPYIDPKMHAIHFAKWVSKQVLDDFWDMSIEDQEKEYERFLNRHNISLDCHGDRNPTDYELVNNICEDCKSPFNIDW